jgi:glutamate dehydrogenase/leucine dehydrogenase
MDRPTSVFTLMEKRGLTTLEIFHKRKEGRFLLRGAKEWGDDIQFSRYMTDFTYLDILTEDYKAFGTKTLASDFKETGLEDYLEQIKQLLREGKHEGIEFYYHRKRNIRVAFCKHSVTVGLQNRKHAIRTGAMRRHELNKPEIDVLIDGLNLSRAMTYKNATASLPYGGCKTVVQCDQVKIDDFETMGFLSYVTDRCRCFPGADMGLDEETVDIIREKYTKNFIGGTKSPLASTGTPTAYGEFVAIKEASYSVYGSRDLRGKKIAVQGLGHVGYPLAEYLLDDGAKLIVTDLDLAKVHELWERYGSDSVQYVTSDEIYSVDADVLSPCAMGGIVTEERIPEFKFKIIIGSANNQLKATNKQAEIELAKKIADAGILFIVDWAHNVGGVIAAALLWQLQGEATEEQLKPKIELPCRVNLGMLLEEARKTGRTPTELAYEKAEIMIYPCAKFSEQK